MHMYIYIVVATNLLMPKGLYYIIIMQTLGISFVVSQVASLTVQENNRHNGYIHLWE
jgi:hypothetical protein